MTRIEVYYNDKHNVFIGSDGKVYTHAELKKIITNIKQKESFIDWIIGHRLTIYGNNRTIRESFMF